MHDLRIERDGLGLVMGGRRDDEADAGKSVGEARAPVRQEIVGGEEFLPALRALRWTQRLADESRAARAASAFGSLPGT